MHLRIVPCLKLIVFLRTPTNPVAHIVTLLAHVAGTDQHGSELGDIWQEGHAKGHALRRSRLTQPVDLFVPRPTRAPKILCRHDHRVKSI